MDFPLGPGRGVFLTWFVEERLIDWFGRTEEPKSKKCGKGKGWLRKDETLSGRMRFQAGVKKRGLYFLFTCLKITCISPGCPKGWAELE